MPRCATCKLDKPVEEFRRKSAGARTRPGFVFPVCKLCEHEDQLEQAANELRDASYTITTPPRPRDDVQATPAPDRSR